MSCFSKNSHAVLQGAVIRYAENGTLLYIKGKNLSSNLDNNPQFCILKREGRYGEIVYQFLLNIGKLLKIDDPQQEFKIIGVTTDSLKYKHVKLQQVHNGIAVWGRSISVHLNQDNRVYLFQGRYEPTLKDVDTTPSISEKEAEKRVISQATGGQGGCRVQGSKLFIFMVGDQIPRLAYRITLVQGLMHREYYFVDAGNGKILHILSGTPKQDTECLTR